MGYYFIFRLDVGQLSWFEGKPVGEKSEIGLIKNKNKGSGKVNTKVGQRTGQTGTLCSF